jgi:Fe-S-cluster-containing dehydrogenase component
MKKWNMIVDIAKCHNCYNCFVATKDEYVGNEHPGVAAAQPLHGHNWVDIECKERGQWPMVEASFRPVMCNHCDDAPCAKAAKDGAIHKRDDGLVIIDPEKARGQDQIVDACPYGAIYWNDELQIPQAWPFDAHLLAQGWDRTKLESVCPTGVFKSVRVADSEMQQTAREEHLVTLESRAGAKPRVYYKNNHLFDACFIGGTIITNMGGQEECVDGAKVRALKDDEEIGRTQSNAFGEFKIDGLSPNLGSTTLHVDIAGKPTKTREIELVESLYVGYITV